MVKRPNKNMQRIESYARELHGELLAKFRSRKDIELAIEGGGVHWNCTARKENNFCKVHCFELPLQEVPEYLIYFERSSNRFAAGRAASIADTVNAVASWLTDATVSELYEKFDFVDKNKRKFFALEATMLKVAPELDEHAKHGLVQWANSDIHYLRFDTDSRSVHFSFWAKNEIPDCHFDWDGCNLLKTQVDDGMELGLAAKRWLYDQAQPSEMADEFFWFEVTKLAKFYEEGKGIEGEFVVSWDKIETSFQRFSERTAWATKALDFISELRAAGYDHQLRAGQSMATFIVSRSRRHGLRPEQPGISFRFSDKSIEASFGHGFGFAKGETKTAFLDYRISDELRNMLDALISYEID